MPIITSLSPSKAENQRENQLGNVGVKGALGNERERAGTINEFFAWEFSEEDIKRTSILK